MSASQIEIPNALKIAIRIVSGFALFIVLLGGSLAELAHISDLGRTARAFAGILVVCLPLYVALRAVAVPGRRWIVAAFFVNATPMLLVLLIAAVVLIDDFDRAARGVPIIGLASLPFLFNAIAFAVLWRRGRSGGVAAEPRGSGGLESQADDSVRHAKAHSHTNYLLRHWRGELPLWVAFWLNWLVIAAATTSVLRTLVSEMLSGGYPVRSIAIAGILVSAGVLLVSIWSVVGVWRSASRRRAKGSGGSWQVLARGVIVLGAIGTLQQLWIYTVPEIVENAQFLAGPDSIGSVALQLSSDRRVLEVHGMVGTGTYDAVKAALDESPTVKMLELDSTGGRVFEAAAIAHLVKDRELDVKVSNECLSACTFVLLAGRNRIASPTAWIGFHRPSGQAPNKAVEENLVRRSMILYRRTGLPEDFVSRIQQTSNDNMWFPRMDELKAAGVITHVSAGPVP
jgi:ATP-dependent protease ClpP protease subunit